jgi:hypothetical protein
MSIAVISLIALVAVIVICAIKGTNPGILGLAFSFILGFFIVNAKGVAVSSPAGACAEILAGFPRNMFLRFVFIAILFGIAKNNGTLKRIIYFMLKLIGGRLALVPVVLFLLLTVIGFFGGGGIPLLMIIMMITSDICKEADLDYFKVAVPVYAGQLTGINSRMSVLGLATQEYAGRYGFNVSVFLERNALLYYGLSFVIFYFAMGCHKFQKRPIESIPAPEKFELVHVRSTLALIIFAILALAGFEVSITSIAIAGVLVYMDKLNEKDIIGMVSWPTMLMLAGMGMFIATIQATGGVALLSNMLNSFMNETRAGPLFAVIGSVLSMVADGGGTITPAMVPVAADLAISNGLDGVKLIVALTLGMCTTSLSPISTGGATVLSCQTGYSNPTRLYTKLLITSIIWSVVQAIFIAFNIFI